MTALDMNKFLEINRNVNRLPFKCGLEDARDHWRNLSSSRSCKPPYCGLDMRQSPLYACRLTISLFFYAAVLSLGHHELGLCIFPKFFSSHPHNHQVSITQMSACLYLTLSL